MKSEARFTRSCREPEVSNGGFGGQIMKYQSELSPVSSSLAEIEKHLEFKQSRILELGCGTAKTTIQLALAHPDCQFIATEVDLLQHRKNLEVAAPSNLEFRIGGGENIDLPDQSMDAVIMLKSFHHVPIELMDQCIAEIGRVLKPAGKAYISEPVYAGEFNRIGSLFNDEKQVRAAAFARTRAAVDSGMFELIKQIFFDDLRVFRGFSGYENEVLGQTHTDFDVDEILRNQIRHEFEKHLDAEGIARFRCPQRVDLLRRPG